MGFLLLIFLTASCFCGRTRAVLKVSVPSSPVRARPGSDAELPCYLSDSSGPLNLDLLDVVWRVGTKNIARYDEGVKIYKPGAEMTVEQLQAGNATLLLRSVKDEDAAVYTCLAIHMPDSGQGKVELRVEGGTLQVQAEPSLVTAAVGDDALLKCIFTVGDGAVDLSRLTVQWFHRGKQLAEFDEVVTISRPDVSLSKEELATGNASLILSRVAPENSGKYRCYVTYSPELERREVTLQVEDSSQASEEDLDTSLSSPACLSYSDVLNKMDQIVKALEQLEAKLDTFLSSKASAGCVSNAGSQDLPANH